MKYCCACGSDQIKFKIPAGDNRSRYTCENCGEIHYQNPRIICGSLPIFEDKILLCKRAIEPRRGFWTLPAGFMENGETTFEAAIRETYEEALANVSLHGLYTVFNLPHINQVQLFFRGALKSPDYGSGEESLAVECFSKDQIPWDELAFLTVRKTLQYYFEDQTRGEYPIRVEDIDRRS